LWLGRRFPFNTQAGKAKDIHEAESRAKNYKAFCLNLFRESNTYRSGKLGQLQLVRRGGDLQKGTREISRRRKSRAGLHSERSERLNKTEPGRT
jgi:hypothetical protein